MTALAAVLTAALSWWLATGIVIALARAGEARFGMVMAFMTALAGAGILGLFLTADEVTAASAYHAFFAALLLWAWHETAFLLGIVTGPRRIEAGAEPRARSRFHGAFQTVRDHELALAATAVCMIALMAGSANKAGLYTFLILWVMRISTKLNIYLGARHAISDMLPVRLAYLKSYFRTDRTSRWFWVSLGGVALLFIGLTHLAASAPHSHDTVKWSLIASFAGLALIEHLFLVLPVRDSALWAWAMERRTGNKTGTACNNAGQAAKAGTTGYTEPPSAPARTLHL